MIDRQSFRNRGIHRRLARQHVPRLLAQYHVSLRGDKTAEKRDLLLLAAKLVERQPEVVGMFEDALVGIVRGELLFREHELALGHDVVLESVGFVEGINRQRTGDLDRLAPFVRIVDQSPAEAANGLTGPAGHHGFRPIGHELHRPLKLAVLAGAPGDVLLQIKVRATHERGKHDREQRIAALHGKFRRVGGAILF